MKHTKAMLHRLACAVVACTVAVSFTAAAFAETAKGQQKLLVMQPVEAPATSGMTAQQIAAGLGKARQYGIVADTLENDTDFETNIAVNTLTGSNGEIGNTHDMTYPTATTLTVHASAPQGSYQFGVYADENAKQVVDSPVTVITDETGTGTAAVQNLITGKPYYVVPFKGGIPDTANQEAVVMSQTTDSLEGGAVSYVGTVNSSVGSLTLKSAENTKSTVIFGKGNSLSGEGGQRTLKTSSSQYMVNLNGGSVMIDDGTQDPDVSGMLSSLSGFAGQLNGLAQNRSEDATVKVLNLSTTDGSAESLRQAVGTAMGFQDANSVQNNGIPLKANQYLIINVNSSADVTSLPEVKIGGVNPGNNWDSVASRIIWNFGAYSKTVHTSANAGTLGTLLAPDATVLADGSSVNGPVYAKDVRHTSGGEIHRIPFQVASAADVYFKGSQEEGSSSSEVVIPSSSSSETSSSGSSAPSNGSGSSAPSNGSGSSSSSSTSSIPSVVESNSSSESSSSSSSSVSSTPSKVESNSSSSESSSSSSSSTSSTPSVVESNSSSSESSSFSSSSVSSTPSKVESNSSSSESSSSVSSTPSKVESNPGSHGSGSNSSSSASSTPSKVESNPDSHGSGRSSSSSSVSSTPSEIESNPGSHGSGSSSSSSTVSYPYVPPFIPTSSVSSSTTSSETPSQENSSTPSKGTGESVSSTVSSENSSETPSAESNSKPINGAGTVSSKTPSTDPSTPVSNENGGSVVESGKLPQTGMDVIPILITFAGGIAIMLYGVVELLQGRSKKHE